ncbi:MAG TPA: mandelate racemase/muconate lactonizing enzyme family protein [Ramlibacter sp.]|nr:mandelate racemase/muconate lactonizing enzyme family protein [Ramlibacter sp.]
MRITAVTGTIYHQKVAHRPVIPPAFRAGKPTHTTLLVRVDTDEGLVGWGEGFGHYGMAPATRTALEELVAPRAIGQDPADESLASRITDALYVGSASGPVAYAISGLDIALWDLRGKAAGRPVHELLGGARTDKLKAYASFSRYGDARVVEQEGHEAVRRGYPGIKLHEVRRPEIEAGARVCQAAGLPLMVDANCHWRPAELQEVCRWMPPLLWLEEPVWPPENHAALADLRRRHRVPTAAGECTPSVTDFERMMALGAVDFAQPSVTKIGGITAMRRVMQQAQRLGVGIAPHSPYYGPGLIATLHLCAALAPDALVEHLFYDFEGGPFGAAVVPEQGRFALPHAPGLGVEPDLRVLRELADA